MRLVLVGEHRVRHTALAVVRARAAELVEADVLAGDRLDDVGTGDEHVRGLVDHHGEVGDGGGVDRAAGARAHDQRDLRDDAGGQDVAPEDLAVEPEGDHALLDARAARVVDADHRHAGLHREVHDLDDLLAEDLAEAAAEDGEVLGEHAHRAAVDRAVAGDDAVAVGPVVGQVEVVGAVPRERVELDEGALVEQHVDPLARGRLAAGVLLVDRLLAGRVRGRLAARLEVRDLARGGLRVVGRRLVGELWRCGHRTSPLASRRRPVRPSASRYLSHVDHAISGDPGSPSGRETELTTRTRTWDDDGPPARARRAPATTAGDPSPCCPRPARPTPTRPSRRARACPEGFTVVADEQSSGRGRLDRAWESP